MSYCKNFGKDRVIFITKEDHEKPSTIQLPDDPEDEKRESVRPHQQRRRASASEDVDLMRLAQASRFGTTAIPTVFCTETRMG
ncbi:uncharacterized protein LOC125941977 isoform X1 [Dermacentor silvarum]|uniref:uncharacterized protein LOC125941977 isoform X1 n=1 Tax=Dermacentor silvarum TaxID=543639 RepID=UPI002101724E|nr:uncharacterized protein LOC125941977 isoform X1 [Dermacentor silvarum]